MLCIQDLIAMSMIFIRVFNIALARRLMKLIKHSLRCYRGARGARLQGMWVGRRLELSDGIEFGTVKKLRILIHCIITSLILHSSSPRLNPTSQSPESYSCDDSHLGRSLKTPSEVRILSTGVTRVCSSMQSKFSRRETGKSFRESVSR